MSDDSGWKMDADINLMNPFGIIIFVFASIAIFVSKLFCAITGGWYDKKNKDTNAYYLSLFNAKKKHELEAAKKKQESSAVAIEPKDKKVGEVITSKNKDDFNPVFEYEDDVRSLEFE